MEKAKEKEKLKNTYGDGFDGPRFTGNGLRRNDFSCGRVGAVFGFDRYFSDLGFDHWDIGR